MSINKMERRGNPTITRSTHRGSCITQSVRTSNAYCQRPLAWSGRRSVRQGLRLQPRRRLHGRCPGEGAAWGAIHQFRRCHQAPAHVGDRRHRGSRTHQLGREGLRPQETPGGLPWQDATIRHHRQGRGHVRQPTCKAKSRPQRGEGRRKWDCSSDAPPPRGRTAVPVLTSAWSHPNKGRHDYEKGEKTRGEQLLVKAQASVKQKNHVREK